MPEGEVAAARERPCISVRASVPGDVALLAGMNLRLIRDEGHRNAMTAGQLEERMAGWLRSGEYRAWVFETGDRVPVGYSLCRHGDGEVHIRQFYIDRPYRRRGWGREAVGFLLSEAFAPGVRVTLEVLVSNPGGEAFWRAVGFGGYAVTMERLASPG